MTFQTDTWKPEQYGKFRNEREAPGIDLIAGITPGRFQQGIDLGCGTGELTCLVRQSLNVESMIGLDSSEMMLARARSLECEGLHFLHGRIEDFTYLNEYDLVFSNAAVHWCVDHGSVLNSIVRGIREGGQLAIQIPANHDYPTHRLADELALQTPYRALLNGIVRPSPVESPEWYSKTLFRLGIREPRVELKVYPHLLETRDSVLEWVKGTLLTWYESRLPAEKYEQFLGEYRTRLFHDLPDQRPFLYPFKRLFLWGRKSS